MLKMLLARLGQGRRTLRFPPQPPALPERYRGRPVREGAGPACDLGSSLFSPEEEAAALRDGHPMRFGGGYAMATRRREDLLATADEIKLATALSRESLRLFGRSLRLRCVSAGGCSGCEAELN